MPRGYDRRLYIIPFDHCGSFEKGMFGWQGELTPEQAAKVAAARQAIYDGFKAAIAADVDRDKAGILAMSSSVRRFCATPRRRDFICAARRKRATRQNSISNTGNNSPHTSRHIALRGCIEGSGDSRTNFHLRRGLSQGKACPERGSLNRA